MGLNNIATKYFVKYPRNSHHYFLTSLSLRALGAIISVLIGSIFATQLNISSDQLPYVITLLILQSFTIFYLVEYYFLANNKVTFTLKIRLFVLTFIGIAKLVVILNGANLFNLIILHGVEYCLIGIGYLWLYYQQGHYKHQKRSLNTHSLIAFFHKGKWLLLSGVAAILYLKIDQLMLAHYYNMEEVAYYAAAAKLSEFWYVFPILIANAFNPKLINLHRKNKVDYHQVIIQLLSFMIASALFISLLTYLFSDIIINVIYGEQFVKSAEILNVHIYATLFIFQRAVLSKWLIAEGYYKHSLLTHGIGAISNVALNLILIPRFGGIGAAWATLFSYMIASFLSLAFSKQTQPFMMLMCHAMLKWPFYLKKQSTKINRP